MKRIIVLLSVLSILAGIAALGGGWTWDYLADIAPTGFAIDGS